MHTCLGEFRVRGVSSSFTLNNLSTLAHYFHVENFEEINYNVRGSVARRTVIHFLR